MHLPSDFTNQNQSGTAVYWLAGALCGSLGLASPRNAVSWPATERLPDRDRPAATRRQNSIPPFPLTPFPSLPHPLPLAPASRLLHHLRTQYGKPVSTRLGAQGCPTDNQYSIACLHWQHFIFQLKKPPPLLPQRSTFECSLGGSRHNFFSLRKYEPNPKKEKKKNPTGNIKMTIGKGILKVEVRSTPEEI